MAAQQAGQTRVDACACASACACGCAQGGAGVSDCPASKVVDSDYEMSRRCHLVDLLHQRFRDCVVLLYLKILNIESLIIS